MTKQSKHTPGPWTIGNGISTCVWADSAKHYVVIPSPQMGDRKEEMVANAKLIAAAPTLLKVAQQLVGMHDAAINGGGECACNTCRPFREAIADAGAF